MAHDDGSSPLARNDSEEIDRIMKEIEDLEKNMDSETDAVQQKTESVIAAENAATESRAASSDVAQQESAIEDSGEGSENTPQAMPSNVISMNRTANMNTESLAETDAVPALDEPLMKSPSAAAAGEGALSLKIGGCAEVSLEFERAGMAVKLSCNDQGLTITTDSGAEFRVPFKQAA